MYLLLVLTFIRGGHLDTTLSLIGTRQVAQGHRRSNGLGQRVLPGRVDDVVVEVQGAYRVRVCHFLTEKQQREFLDTCCRRW